MRIEGLGGRCGQAAVEGDEGKPWVCDQDSGGAAGQESRGRALWNHLFSYQLIMKLKEMLDLAQG